jgi:hypothetical protein
VPWVAGFGAQASFVAAVLVQSSVEVAVAVAVVQASVVAVAVEAAASLSVLPLFLMIGKEGC